MVCKCSTKKALALLQEKGTFFIIANPCFLGFDIAVENVI
jgi:hypothetical protein